MSAAANWCAGPTNGSTSGTSASSTTGHPGSGAPVPSSACALLAPDSAPLPLATRLSSVRYAVAMSVGPAGGDVPPVESTTSEPATTISTCGSASSWASVGMVMSSAPRRVPLSLLLRLRGKPGTTSPVAVQAYTRPSRPPATTSSPGLAAVRSPALAAPKKPVLTW